MDVACVPDRQSPNYAITTLVTAYLISIQIAFLHITVTVKYCHSVSRIHVFPYLDYAAIFYF